MILTKHKIVITGVILGGALLLSACGSHKNPLLTAKPKDAAAFLVKASKVASKKLNVFPNYDRCMVNRESFINPFTKKDIYHKTCDPIYAAMAAYGKTTKKFKTITASDISDKKMYAKLSRAISNAQLHG